MVLPSVSGLLKSVHVGVSKAVGDRAITSVSGETVSHSASILNGRSHLQRSGLTVEAALSMTPAQLASTHFPTHPQAWVSVHGEGSSSSGHSTLGRR